MALSNSKGDASREAVFASLRNAESHVRSAEVMYFPASGEWIWSETAFRLFRLLGSGAIPAMSRILARVHPGDLVHCREHLMAWLSGEVMKETLEFRVVNRDGSRHWLRIEPGIQHEGMNREKCLLYLIEDISREKALEEEMGKAMEHERELSRIKMEFLHMITHEYRTPLGVIQSSADILIRYHDRLGEKERLERLEDIKRSTRILTDLVEDVLMIGKSDSGKDQVHVEPVQLCPLLREVADAVIDNFGFPRDVSIESADPGLSLMSDEQLLRHVFSNAISNALKYSTLDKPVRIQVEPNGKSVAVRIEDKGIGIPEEDLAKLFTMFHRASNVGSIAGTGLGLVVLKRCVDRLKGKIHVHSKVGQGSTFTFLLPRKAGSNPSKKAIS